MTKDTKSQSCIKTKCTVPNATVVRWLLGMFPELYQDARLSGCTENYEGGVNFIIEHTVQAPRPAGPILLEPVNSDVEDAEVTDGNE